MRTYLYQINVTRDCNLRCTHCYIHSDVKKASKHIEPERAVELGRKIREHMLKIGYDRAEIHFIGGEPSMLGLDWFEQVIPALRKELDGFGFSYELLLVSNLLHKDIVGMAKLFDRLTTSYEPVTRFPKQKLEDMWLDSVRQLQDSGVVVGVTTAITKPVINYGAKRLLDEYFEMGIFNIHLGFFIPSGDGLVNQKLVFPEFSQTSGYLIEAAKWQLEMRDKYPHVWVNPFESMLASITTGDSMDDIVCPIISGSMDINWDGNSVTCLEAGGELNVDWAGNVFESSVVEVASSKKFMMAVAQARRPRAECAGCDEYQSCKSGCGVLFKYWKPDVHQDCPGFKSFIKFVRGCVESGVKPRYTEYNPVGC